MPDYFTLAELRALPDMSDTVKYTAEAVEAASEYITGVIEREVGTSFITRMVVDEPHNGGGSSIILRRGFVQSVVSATDSGVAVTDDLVLSGGVLLRLSGTSPTTWTAGYSNVLVTYEYGYSTTPPADIKAMALKGTRAHLMATSSNSGINDRQTSVNSGDSTINFVVAGQDRPTGYPDVDATILGWKARLDVFGFA